MKGNLRGYFLRKIGGSFVLGAAALAVELASLAVVIRIVGREGYGIAGLFMSLVSLIGFVEVGLGAYVTKSLSELKGRLTSEDAGRILSSGAYGLVGLGLLFCLGAGAFSLLFFGPAFSIPPEMEEALLWSRILIVGIVAQAFATTYYNRVLQGLHNFEGPRIVLIAVELARLALLILLLRDSRTTAENVNILLSVRFATNLAAMAALAVLCRKAVGVGYSLSLAKVDRGQLRRSLAFSSPIIGAKLISRLQTIGGVWIVGAVAGAGGAAVLLIAQRIFQGLADLAGSLLMTIFPLSSSLNAQNKQALAGFRENGTYYNMALNAYLAATAGCLAAPVALVFLGGGFEGLRALVLLYGAVLFIGGIYGLGNEMLQGMDRHHRILRHYMLGAGISIACQLGFGMRWGVIGIPLGIVAGWIYFCVQSLRLQGRYLEVGIGPLLAAVARNLAFAGFVLALGLYALPLQRSDTPAELLLWGGIHSAACAAAGWLLILRRKERQHVLGFVRKKLGRPPGP